MDLISIVIPCYNEEDVLPLFYQKLLEVEKSIDHCIFEIIFVDDGSNDHTLEICRNISQAASNIFYISFSRNFGKESALYAGLQRATGQFVVVMDADFQDPLEYLPEMYRTLKTQPEFDCVAARRFNRKGEPPIRSLFAKIFYRLINSISKTEIVDGARDFRMMSRKMVNAVLSLKEYNRFSKGIFGWVGFHTKWISYENIKRVSGESKWSFWKLLLYSIDGITAFSTVPLAFASVIGFCFCMLAIVMTIFFVLKTLIWGDPVPGFPTLICVVLLVGGIQLFCTGILGQYFAKMYLEIKQRPSFIIKETNIDSFWEREANESN